MPPTKPKTNDNILPISNHDFFKNHHCPMRDGNVRCRNISMCSRVHFGDQVAPQKAVQLRDQLVHQIKSFASGVSKPDSLVWAGIETKVVKLIGWVLCQKHLLDRDAMMRMTMEFLKEESGSFDEEQQSAQPQSKEFTYTNNPSSVTLGGSASYSTYASAASHLATPPMSPVAFAQPQAYQSIPTFGDGNLYNREASLFARYGPSQQFPLVCHVDKPIKTEPETTVQHAPSHQQFPVAPTCTYGQQQMPADTQPAKPQKVPFGFGVHTPSKSGRASNTHSSLHTTSRPIISQLPTEGAVVTPIIEMTLKPKATKELPPLGFQVRERVEKDTPAPEPQQSRNSKERTSTTGKHRGTSVAAAKTTPSDTPRSEMDQMVDTLEAFELDNAELKDTNQKLEAKNEALRYDNRRLEARYRAALDRVGELEDEVEGFRAEVHSSKEQMVKMGQDIAILKKLLGVGQ